MASALLTALQAFAAQVAGKLSNPLPGEPEDQLRNPVETLLQQAAAYHGLEGLSIKGESTVSTGGRPDFVVSVGGALAGHIELKSPGKGARPERYKAHDKQQWEMFKALPNVIYTDGNEWALYRTGERIDQVVKLSGNIGSDGDAAVTEQDAEKLGGMLLNFFQWEPNTPAQTADLADLVAPLCRLLRDSVRERLNKPGSPLTSLREDWRRLLFPNATEDEFADAYAQTITFALLLARSEGWKGDSLDNASIKLRAHHSLMGKALQILTDPAAHTGIETSLDVLTRVISRIDPSILRAAPDEPQRLWDEVSLRARDPWIYFYEDFLGAYDAKLRKDAGVYYTPVEVVRCQVRLIDELIKGRLGKPLGFADPSVTTLDPALGTGTYLLGVIDQAFATAAEQIGPAGPASIASDLIARLYGFERMVGPYSVAELRISQAIERFGGSLPDDGINVLLTDTLESPHNDAPPLFTFTKELAAQHQRALKVKRDVPILVCLGNPPYDRHDAPKDKADRAAAGGWVRWGAELDHPESAILQEFIRPVQDAGAGLHAKNLYNLYVYFWRWALWKTFESDDASGGKLGPGIVSYISASSFLMGDAFIGMRRMLRKLCDEVWIIDLGGEGRGTRKEDNVFAIQTPVCITIGFRKGAVNPDKPAKVHYRRLRGKRSEKLRALNDIRTLKQAQDKAVPEDWDAPMTPAGGGAFFNWPEIRDLMPWQVGGSQVKRTWPISCDTEVLRNRWRTLLTSTKQREYFKETRDRKVDRVYSALNNKEKLNPISLEQNQDPIIRPYAYRSFDRMAIIADNRVGDYFRPDLWASFSSHQIFISSLFSTTLGEGPAITSSNAVPDLDCFRGSFGAKACLPLYRDAAATDPNILPGLLDKLTAAYQRKVTPEDFAGYLYGVLAHGGYTARFWAELEACQVRVPLTKDAARFERASAIGKRLIWLHTYGERMVPEGQTPGRVPQGEARLLKKVPDAPENYPEKYDYDAEAGQIVIGGNDLFNAPAGRFGPVSLQVWEFEVSGLKVVQSWLGYRMKHRKGKKSSPLDEIGPERWTAAFSQEFLNLLWILEHTLATYPEQADLLDEIVAGPLFDVSDLPAVPEAMRKPPSGKTTDQLKLGE